MRVFNAEDFALPQIVVPGGALGSINQFCFDRVQRPSHRDAGERQAFSDYALCLTPSAAGCSNNSFGLDGSLCGCWLICRRSSADRR